MAGRKFNIGRQNEQVLNQEWHELFMALKYLNDARYFDDSGSGKTNQERQEEIPNRALRFKPTKEIDVLEAYNPGLKNWEPLFKRFYHPANTNKLIINENDIVDYQLALDPETGVLNYYNPNVMSWVPVGARIATNSNGIHSGLSFQFLSPLEESKKYPGLYQVPNQEIQKGRLFSNNNNKNYIFSHPTENNYEADSDIGITINTDKIQGDYHWIHLDSSKLQNTQKRLIKIDKNKDSVYYGYINVSQMNTEFYGFSLERDKEGNITDGDPRGYLLVKERTKNGQDGDYVSYESGIMLSEDVINKYDYIYTITHMFSEAPITVGSTITNSRTISGPSSYYVGMIDGDMSLFVDGLALESKYTVDQKEQTIYTYIKQDGTIQFSSDREGEILNDMQMSVLIFPNRTDDYTFAIDDESNETYGALAEYDEANHTMKLKINEDISKYATPVLFYNGLSLLTTDLTVVEDIVIEMEGKDTFITVNNFELAEGELYTFYIADIGESFTCTGTTKDGIIKNDNIKAEADYIVIVNGLLMTPTNGDIAVNDKQIKLNRVHDIDDEAILTYSIFEIDQSNESKINLAFDGDVASYSVRIDDSGLESVYDNCNNAIAYLGNAILLDRDAFKCSPNSIENYYKNGQIIHELDEFDNEVYYICKSTGEKELLDPFEAKIIDNMTGYYVGKGSINLLLTQDQIENKDYFNENPVLTFYAYTYCNQIDEALIVGNKNDVAVEIGTGKYPYQGKASRFDVWLTGNNSLSTYYNGLMIENEEINIEDGTTREFEVMLPKLNISEDKLEILEWIYERFIEVVSPSDLLTDEAYKDILQETIKEGLILRDVYMTHSLVVSALELIRHIKDELRNETITYVIEEIEGYETIAAYRDFINLETYSHEDNSQVNKSAKDSIIVDFALAPAIINVYHNGVLMDDAYYHKFDNNKIMFEEDICGLQQLPDIETMKQCLNNKYLSKEFKESIITDYENSPKKILRVVDENGLYYIPTNSRDTVLVEKRTDMNMKSITFDVEISSYGTLDFTEDYYDLPRSLGNTMDHIKIYINGVLYKGEYELVNRYGSRGIHLLSNEELKIDPLYEYFNMYPSEWERCKHLFGTEKYERKIDKITFEWR